MDPRDEILKSKGVDPKAHYGVEENEEGKSTPHSSAAGAAQAVDPFGSSAIIDEETRSRLSESGVSIPTSRGGEGADVAPKAATSLNRDFVQKLLRGGPVEGSKNKAEDEETRVTEEEDEAEGKGAPLESLEVGTASEPVEGSPQSSQKQPLVLRLGMYDSRTPVVKFEGFWTGRDVRIAIRHIWQGYRLHKRDIMVAGAKEQARKLGR